MTDFSEKTYVEDLPPSFEPMDGTLIQYLAQIVASPQDEDANPQKLRYLVAFFDDQPGRAFIHPGMEYQHRGYVGGPSDNIECTTLKRADTALSVIFIEPSPVGEQPKASGWIYVARNHGKAR